MSDEARFFLKWLLPNITPNYVMAEIGVAEGFTTGQYIEKLKECSGTVYCIDWWNGNIAEYAEHRHGYNPPLAESRKERFVNSFTPYDNIKMISDVSWLAATQLADNSLDCCFIDAGHTYSFCKADILAFGSKVKLGGMLCGHDYTFYGNLNDVPGELFDQEYSYMGHVGVVKAVTECLDGYYTVDGDCWFCLMTPAIQERLNKIKQTFQYPEV